MIHNENRIGNFTSSDIAALMKKDKVGGLGAPAYTYIDEKKMERRLGRSLDSESRTKPLTWGKLMEQRIFDLLGTEYQLVSQETLTHSTIPFWAGSPDGSKFDEGKTVVEFKCPMTMKSFCQLVDPLYDGLTGMDAMNKIREKHAQGETYYWQIVSNSILDQTKFAELIVYCPYLSELQGIRDYACNIDSAAQFQFAWINNAQDDELPYLVDCGFYKNINIMRFEVPEEDKTALTERVLRCGELLGVPTIIPKLKTISAIIKV